MAGVVNIGASTRTIWTEWLITSLEQHKYPGPIYLVNPKYGELYGRPCFADLDALPEQPDVAFIAVGADQALVQVKRLVARGCSRIVVVSNGFSEIGSPEGRAREEALRAICAGHDEIEVIGPNCLGFASFHDRLNAIAQPVSHGLVPGPVSVVSQSGGLTSGVLGALVRDGIGADVCYSIGNGAVDSLERVLMRVARRPTTTVVCAIVEAVRDPDGLARAVATARAAGKEIVALVLGRSANGRRAAQSHTGAVLSGQGLLASWLARQGVVVVDSIEEMGRAAAMLLSIGHLRPGSGAFVVTASGGAATLGADLAEKSGAVLAGLERGTVEEITRHLPPGAFVGNPLDVTAGNGPAGSAPVYEALVKDSGVGCLVEPWVLRFPDDSPAHHWHRAALERIAAIAASAGVPFVVSSVFAQPLTDWARTFARREGVSVTSGLELTLGALAKIAASERARRSVPHRSGQLARISARPTFAEPAATGSLVGEARAREVLATAGVAIPAGIVATSVEDAASAASTLRPPFVVKLAAPEVAHKGNVGGVEIGLVDDAGVWAACRRIAESAREAGVLTGLDEAHYLVAEMVFGPELMVSAVRDLVAGPHLALGGGGWAAEVGPRFGTLAAVADEDELAASLGDWGLPALLGASRSAALAAFLAQLGRSFVTGTLAGYQTVEINPLILSARGAVAADVLLHR